MEKIYFDDSTFIWKGKLNFSNYKNLILTEVTNVIKNASDDNKKTDAYKYFSNDERTDFGGNISILNKLDEICQLGIDSCKKLYENQFNKVNTDSWINVVRSKNPIQHKLRKHKYHIHTELQSNIGSFFPHYTYVYYIQMPDFMENEDGVLFVQGTNEKEYWIRPEEDDLIILPGYLPHSVSPAINSTIDRIVMAGNVGFDYIKQTKSLM
jgi:hypothetical protein